MEMHVPEGKSFPTLVNRDISKTLDYPDSKLATPDVDSTSRPLLPPEYTSPSSSPSTIENEEYLSVAATEIGDDVGNDRIESLSVGKLASTTCTPTSSIRFRFRKGGKSMLRSRVPLAYIKSSVPKDRRRLDILSSTATYGRQRPASPVLTRISAVCNPLQHRSMTSKATRVLPLALMDWIYVPSRFGFGLSWKSLILFFDLYVNCLPRMTI